MSAAETIIVWEDLEEVRYELRNGSTGETKVLYLKPDQEKDATLFRDGDVELDVVDKMPLVEWFANHYREFGAGLEFVTDRSQEGSQFVKGFGGVGCILRWAVDFVEMDAYEDDSDSD